MVVGEVELCVVMVQSPSAIIHGAIVIDFIPLLWKRQCSGDKNLVNVGWTHYNRSTHLGLLDIKIRRQKGFA